MPDSRPRPWRPVGRPRGGCRRGRGGGAGDDSVQSRNLLPSPLSLPLLSLMAAMQLPQRALDGSLVPCRRLVVLPLELGVAHIGGAVLAPILWCRFPMFRHASPSSASSSAVPVGAWEGGPIHTPWDEEEASYASRALKAAAFRPAVGTSSGKPSPTSPPSRDEAGLWLRPRRRTRGLGN